MKRRGGKHDLRRRSPSGATKAVLPAEHAPERMLQVEKPIYGGNFLARDEGKAVFVPLALPGEQVRVRLLEQKKAYASAELEQVITPSPKRVAPGCQHFGRCGGCGYQHGAYEAQLAWKEAILRETFERGGVTPPLQIGLLAGEPWHYRNRIRLAFDAAGNPGYRGRRSHALVPIRECPIAAPLLVRAALAFAEAFRRLAPQQRPSEMALFCNGDETQLLLTLFTRTLGKAAYLEELTASSRLQIPQLAGIEVAHETGEGRPPRTLARTGDFSLLYRAAGFGYRVDQGAFFQVNRWLVDNLVERAIAGQGGSLAWDLFAGVGLFARQLTTSFKRVVAVESAPAAREALTANLAGTGGEAVSATTLDFLRRSETAQVPDLVLVDPPRTGLGADLTERLAGLKPESIVYVSCDPATLARDLRSLLASGYALASVTLADLFPQTFHLETVVHLRRS